MNVYLREFIKKLKTTDNSEILEVLSSLDSAGILLCPNESLNLYIDRTIKILDEIKAISLGNSQFKNIYANTSKIPDSILCDASKITWNLYGFHADWIPAWESKKIVGIFSEGIQYEINGFFPMIFLKNVKSKNSAQILAHEMCHAVKTSFPMSVYDEWFPRNTEIPLFRKIFGNFFRNWHIPTISLISIFAGIIFIALEKFIPWGIFALIPIAIVFLREIYLWNILTIAKNKLQKAGFDALPLLFRMNDTEIRIVAKSRNPATWIDNCAKNSLRWKMYAVKFKSSINQ